MKKKKANLLFAPPIINGGKYLVSIALLTVLGVYPPLARATELPVNVETVFQQKDGTVRGTISDAQGQPLPGVAVLVKGSSRGVTSDINGYYIIDASKGDVLLFTSIGYSDYEVTVKNQSSLNVVLQEAVTELEETVVVGMGHQRKASVVGSISSVKVDALRVPQRNLTNALSGKMAGTVVVQRSGEPGQDNADFWIRGISTFGSNQRPLILVDGVERSMSDLSIEEVESISILKDASATAVYGVRAANGVVLITTRKGVAQKTTIEVKLESGVSDVPNLPKLLDGANYARLYNEAAGYENYSEEYIQNLENHSNTFLYPNVNWVDQLFNKFSNNTNASINIRGGGQTARYFINASFIQDNGNLKNSRENEYKSNINLRRYNFRSNIDLTLSKSTILNIEIGANMTDMHSPGVGNEWLYGMYYTPAEMLFHYSFMSTPLSCPVRVPIGRKEEGDYIWGWGAPAQIGEVNPAERLFGSGYDKTFRSQIMSQIILKQDLSMLTKGLEFTAAYSFDAYNNTIQNRRRKSTTWAIQGVNDDTGDFEVKEISKGNEYLGYGHSTSSNRAQELKLQLNYNRVFKENHRVGAMFMYYQRDFVNSTAGSSITSLPYRKQGLALRATYSYADRYMIEYNMGYNGSENFPKGQRFGIFPAIALGYMVSNEPWWKVDFINVLKIRGSIGLVGSESLPGGNRFAYLSTYGGGLGSYAFGPNGEWINGVGEDQEGIADLTWEKGLKKNIGFESKWFGSRFSLEMDYFHERRYDILIQRQSIPSIAGLNKSPYANMGVMTNQGVEASLEFADKIGDFGYRLYGNFTYNHNKVLEQDEPFGTVENRRHTGHRYGQQFGLVALGLFADEQDIADSPEQMFGEVRPGDVKYLDYNKDGVVDINDQCAIGYSSIPEINYGFGGQVSWKGIDFGIFFRGQAHASYGLGGPTFIPFTEGVGKNNLYEKALDRWTEENPNPNAFYPRMTNGRNTNNWQQSTRTLYSGDLLRLADMELGYTFPQKMIEKIGMKGLRIYLLANNVALFSPWKLWDPETASNNGRRYPLPRKINIGIRTSF